MKQDKYSPVNLICYACGCIPVIWIALLFAPYLDDGLIGLIKNVGAAFANPLHIVLCRDSLRAVLIFLLIYGLALAVFLSNDRNYRRREEMVQHSGVLQRKSVENMLISLRQKIKS